MNLFYIVGALVTGKETNHDLRKGETNLLKRIVIVILSMWLWPLIILGKVIQKIFRK